MQTPVSRRDDPLAAAPPARQEGLPSIMQDPDVVGPATILATALRDRRVPPFIWREFTLELLSHPQREMKDVADLIEKWSDARERAGFAESLRLAFEGVKSAWKAMGGMERQAVLSVASLIVSRVLREDLLDPTLKTTSTGASPYHSIKG
ncbi:MAG: hypothetical protein HYY13_08235 [Nitrospirae bacterium]|nr:hypothetical protein [Nitrospirota bacterium]